MKTGSRAQFTISRKLETVLSHLPTTGPLFPNLSQFTANDRASRFRRRCQRAGVSGVTLHSYRYAWAERAKTVGMPERFAQAALGHNSKAVHREYARKAQIIVPSLEEYETKAATERQQPAVAAWGRINERAVASARLNRLCGLGTPAVPRPRAKQPENLGVSSAWLGDCVSTWL